MASRFSNLLNEEELDMLVDEAQPGNTKKATSTSVWLRAVTDFREEKPRYFVCSLLGRGAERVPVSVLFQFKAVEN